MPYSEINLDKWKFANNRIEIPPADKKSAGYTVFSQSAASIKMAVEGYQMVLERDARCATPLCSLAFECVVLRCAVRARRLRFENAGVC